MRRHSFPIAVLVSLLFATLTLPAAGTAGFGDVNSGAFYEEAVQWMVDNEITLGTSPGCFSPNDSVTRGQAAAFMWRMEGEPESTEHPFVDITKSWQDDPVAWMSEQAITVGTSATEFSPSREVTRGQAAAFLHRLAGEPDPVAAHGFGDVTQAWLQDAVAWMAEQGITSGTTANTFSPADVVTRAQLAAFFYRYQGEPAVELDNASPACGANPGAGSGPLADDSFDGGPANLLSGDTSVWRVRNSNLAALVDIDRTVPGALLIVPRQEHHNGWYQTNEGPYVYQEVSGDFAVAVRLSVLSAADSGAGMMPGPAFNSGGFVVRDPDSAHDWVMYNMGNQSSGFGYGREVKTTVNAASVLNLYPQSASTHRLLLCRVGAEVHYFHGSSGGTDWTEEAISHHRPDFGDTLQVGFIANAWEDGPEPWIEIEEVHFGSPSSVESCTSAIPSF